MVGHVVRKNKRDRRDWRALEEQRGLKGESLRGRGDNSNGVA